MNKIISHRDLKTLSRYSAMVVCASVVLGACQGGNKSSDVEGPISGPSTDNPVSSSEPTTQTSLLINRPVKGLSFSCDGDNNTFGTIEGYQESTTDKDRKNDNFAALPIAQCDNTAESVTFFLGQKDVEGFGEQINLGTSYLPLTVKGKDGKKRVSSAGRQKASSSNFRFNLSMLDLPRSPTSADLSEFPKDSKVQKTVYKAALLMALNAKPKDTAAPITIPEIANKIIGFPSGYSDVTVPTDFDYKNYSAFKNDWNDYLQAVDSETSISGWPQIADVTDALDNGAQRLAAGRFSINYGKQVLQYSFSYNNCEFLKLRPMRVNFLAFPDGSLTAFGQALTDSSIESGSIDNCDKDQDVARDGDFVFVGTSAQELEPYSELKPTQEFKNATIQGASKKTTGGNQSDASINLYGQFVNDTLYDGRTAPGAKGKSGYKNDYPNTPNNLSDAQKGSLTGSAFGANFPKYANGTNAPGQVGVDSSDNRPTPLPMQASRSNHMQKKKLDRDILRQLPDYYHLQLMRFCKENEKSCRSIPNSGTEVGSRGNYPEKYCKGYKTDEDDNLVTDEDGKLVCEVGEIPDISKETAVLRQGEADSGNDVYLHFNKTTEPGNVIIELAKKAQNSCSKAKDSWDDSIRLGFVTRTESQLDSVADSVNVSLLFTGKDKTSLINDKIPWLGVNLSGRIDLDQNSMPLYRLSDNNFSDHIRARWIDSFKHQLQDFVKEEATGPNQSPGEFTFKEDLDPEQESRYLGLDYKSGAVKGEAVDSNCDPI